MKLLYKQNYYKQSSIAKLQVGSACFFQYSVYNCLVIFPGVPVPIGCPFIFVIGIIPPAVEVAKISREDFNF